MNSIQFGRWFSERRRLCGWRSQKSLSETIQHHPSYHESGISEDFLARLEAGYLSYPFKGTVRRRVLLLAWFLCKSPRELRTYLRTAGLNDLSGEEQEQIRLFNQHLQKPPLSLLPPRPSQLIGRAVFLTELLHHLHARKMIVCALTGMAGVGKSVLAAEALHQLAANEQERLHYFPDGILTLSATGLHGMQGLILLLHNLAELLEHRTISTIHTKKSVCTLQETVEIALASALTRARAAIAGKRLLILLDDLEADFPLQKALDVLLTCRPGARQDAPQEYRCILLTSRSIPALSLVAAHLPIPVLDEASALELLAALVGREVIEAAAQDAAQICATAGYLPLVIEGIATTLLRTGLPLSQLASYFSQDLFASMTVHNPEILATLQRWLASLSHEIRTYYFKLATLGNGPFGLEDAASLSMWSQSSTGSQFVVPSTSNGYKHSVHLLTKPLAHFSGINQEHLPPLPSQEQLTAIAVALGQLVHHSLLEMQTYPPNPVFQGGQNVLQVDLAQGTPGLSRLRYRMPPLLHAYSLAQIQRLPTVHSPVVLQTTRDDILDIPKHYRDLQATLEVDREESMAALTFAWEHQQYERVIHLVSNMRPPIWHLNKFEGEQLLLKGLYACSQQENWSTMSKFLHQLSFLRLEANNLEGSKLLLQQIKDLVEAFGPATCMLPFRRLAHIVQVLGDEDAAWHYIKMQIDYAHQLDNPIKLGKAYWSRAFLARIHGDKDLAYQDITLYQSYLAESSHEPTSEDLVEKAEIARILGDYPRAQSYFEIAIEHLRKNGDFYSLTDTLYDQAFYAYQEGLYDEARTLLQQTAQMAAQCGFIYCYNNSQRLLERLKDK